MVTCGQDNGTESGRFFENKQNLCSLVTVISALPSDFLHTWMLCYSDVVVHSCSSLKTCNRIAFLVNYLGSCISYTGCPEIGKLHVTIFSKGF